MNRQTDDLPPPPPPPRERQGTYAWEVYPEEQAPPRGGRWGLVVMWVLAVTAAIFLNSVLQIGLYSFLLPALHGGDRFIGPDMQLTLLELTDKLLTGTTLGLLQWLVLRRYVEGIAWWTWTATAVGANLLSFPLIFGFGLVVPWAVAPLGSAGGAWVSMLSVAASQLYSAVIVSLITGGLQWLILQRHLRGAGLWVLAVMGSALLGAFVGLIPFMTLREPGQYDSLGLLPLVIFVITTLLTACITGFTLLWLVNNTRRSNWTYETS